MVRLCVCFLARICWPFGAVSQGERIRGIVFSGEDPICRRVVRVRGRGVMDNTFRPKRRVPSHQRLTARLGIGPGAIRHTCGRVRKLNLVCASKGSLDGVARDRSGVRALERRLLSRTLRKFVRAMQAVKLRSRTILSLVGGHLGRIRIGS